jgi:hypothetical protein
MPFSLDPLPGENEIECGNCGAVIYDQLSRCPECGVNLYEPEADDEYEPPDEGVGFVGDFTQTVRAFLHRLSGKPYSAEEVFGDALDQAFYYQDLLAKVGGDNAAVERLVRFEKELKPNGNRILWLKNAIQRWERDNRISSQL